MTDRFDKPTNSIQQPALSLTILRTLYDYSIWARDRLLVPIQLLDDEQLRQAGYTGVYGSVFSTLAHMAASEWMWLQRAQGAMRQAALPTPTDGDFTDLRVLIVWWNDIHAQSMDYLYRLNEADLNQEVTYMAPDGKARTRKVWHMLLQVTNHQTEHRSQLGTILGSLGLEVPQTDLVVYLSERRV